MMDAEELREALNGSREQELLAALLTMSNEAAALLIAGHAGAGVPGTTPAQQPSSEHAQHLVAEAKRILAAWAADDYDDATDAVQEAAALLRELRGSGEDALLRALQKMSDEACQVLAR